MQNKGKYYITTAIAYTSGKPHIGNLMVKYGYAESLRQAMKDYLNDLKVNMGWVAPEEAVLSVTEYPLDGTSRVLLLDAREWASYPDGCQLPDGRILVVYDFGRTKAMEISFAEFTEADVAAGRDVSGKVRLRRRISGLHTMEKKQ